MYDVNLHKSYMLSTPFWQCFSMRCLYVPVLLSTYRKFELYRMTWSDHMNISEYEIAGSTYGGPIGEYYTKSVY